MKNKNGYTVIELMVVIAVVGVFAFVAINKASYAFSDKVDAENELLNQKVKNIETQAKRYGEENLELFEEGKTIYIRVKDLIDNNYLENNGYSIDENKKIELVLKDKKVKAHLEN